MIWWWAGGRLVDVEGYDKAQYVRNLASVLGRKSCETDARRTWLVVRSRIAMMHLLVVSAGLRYCH